MAADDILVGRHSSSMRAPQLPVRIKRMKPLTFPIWSATIALFLLPAIEAGGQQIIASASAEAPNTIRITVVDETGQSIAGAKVSVREPGLSPVELWTDYAGHCAFESPGRSDGSGDQQAWLLPEHSERC